MIGHSALYVLLTKTRGSEIWEPLHHFSSLDRLHLVMHALHRARYPVSFYKVFHKHSGKHDVYQPGPDYLNHVESYVAPRYNSNRPLALTLK